MTEQQKAKEVNDLVSKVSNEFLDDIKGTVKGLKLSYPHYSFAILTLSAIRTCVSILGTLLIDKPIDERRAIIKDMFCNFVDKTDFENPEYKD